MVKKIYELPMHPHGLLFFRGGPVLVHIQNGLSTCPIYIILLAENGS